MIKQSDTIWKLTEKELEFIITHIKKQNFDLDKALSDQLLLKNILKYCESNEKHQNDLIRSIKIKLGMLSPIDSMYASTHDIPKKTEAKLYFNDHLFTPILLEQTYSEYQLWQLISHRNMDKPSVGEKVSIIVQDIYYRTYRFNTVIKDILVFKDIRYLRLFNSNDVHYLQNRVYPRISADINIFVHHKGKQLCGKITNLSKQGAKISVLDEHEKFKKNERVEISFDLHNQKIEIEIKVVYSENRNLYGVVFEKIDTKHQYEIEKYISNNLQKRI